MKVNSAIATVFRDSDTFTLPFTFPPKIFSRAPFLELRDTFTSSINVMMISLDTLRMGDYLWGEKARVIQILDLIEELKGVII